MTAPPPAEWKPTLRQEFIVIAICAIILGAAVAMEVVLSPGGKSDGSAVPFKVIGGIAALVGQAGWITMDRKRRGREVGVWRWAAILCGPFAICLYLALEYGGKALYLIPLCLAIYIVAIGTGAVAGMIISGRMI